MLWAARGWEPSFCFLLHSSGAFVHAAVPGALEEVESLPGSTLAWFLQHGQLREAVSVCLPTLSKCLLCAALPGKLWRLEQQPGGGALSGVCANSV